MHVCRKFHGNLLRSCWEIWVKVVNQRPTSCQQSHLVCTAKKHNTQYLPVKWHKSNQSQINNLSHICTWESELVIDRCCLPAGPTNSWWLSCPDIATWTSSNLTAETTHGKTVCLLPSLSLYHSIFPLFNVPLFLWWWWWTHFSWGIKLSRDFSSQNAWKIHTK